MGRQASTAVVWSRPPDSATCRRQRLIVERDTPSSCAASPSGRLATRRMRSIGTKARGRPSRRDPWRDVKPADGLAEHVVVAAPKLEEELPQEVERSGARVQTITGVQIESGGRAVPATYQPAAYSGRSDHNRNCWAWRGGRRASGTRPSNASLVALGTEEAAGSHHSADVSQGHTRQLLQSRT
jgi:hypothetical protein